MAFCDWSQLAVTSLPSDDVIAESISIRIHVETVESGNELAYELNELNELNMFRFVEMMEDKSLKVNEFKLKLELPMAAERGTNLGEHWQWWKKGIIGEETLCRQ